MFMSSFPKKYFINLSNLLILFKAINRLFKVKFPVFIYFK